jgi:hypothetical protein
MNPLEWGSLGISFKSSLDFSNFLGSINLNSKVLFNNISYYQSNNLQQIQKTTTRSWNMVKNDESIDFDWAYYRDNFNWRNALVLGLSDLYGINPSEIYKTYLGTNKIIFDDNNGLSIDSDTVKIYQNINWSTNTSLAL